MEEPSLHALLSEIYIERRKIYIGGLLPRLGGGLPYINRQAVYIERELGGPGRRLVYIRRREAYIEISPPESRGGPSVVA